MAYLTSAQKLQLNLYFFEAPASVVLRCHELTCLLGVNSRFIVWTHLSGNTEWCRQWAYYCSHYLGCSPLRSWDFLDKVGICGFFSIQSCNVLLAVKQWKSACSLKVDSHIFERQSILNDHCNIFVTGGPAMCISVSYIFMWFVCLCRTCLWRAALQCCHSWPVVFITSLCLFVHVTARSVFTRHVTRWLTVGAAPGAGPTCIRHVQVVASRRPSTGRWAELISKNIPPPTELTHPSYDACCSWRGPHFCIDPYRPIAEFAAEFLCDENPVKNSASRICRHNFLHWKSAGKIQISE